MEKKPNELPAWELCKRKAEEGTANALERFIYDNEPAAPRAALEFRKALLNVLDKNGTKAESHALSCSASSSA